MRRDRYRLPRENEIGNQPVWLSREDYQARVEWTGGWTEERIARHECDLHKWRDLGCRTNT